MSLLSLFLVSEGLILLWLESAVCGFSLVSLFYVLWCCCCWVTCSTDVGKLLVVDGVGFLCILADFLFLLLSSGVLSLSLWICLACIRQSLLHAVLQLCLSHAYLGLLCLAALALLSYNAPLSLVILFALKSLILNIASPAFF